MDVGLRKKGQRVVIDAAGFTLIELLVSLTLLFLLLGVGVPALASFLSDRSVVSDMHTIRTGLSFARERALRTRSNVVVCRWDGDQNCTGTAYHHAHDWSQGMLVFVDKNQDKQVDVLTEPILKIAEFTNRHRITWGRGEVIVFTPDGRSQAYNGSFYIYGETRTVQMALSGSGRLRAVEN